MLRYLHCLLIYRRGAMYKEWASLSTDRDQPFSATSPNMTNIATVRVTWATHRGIPRIHVFDMCFIHLSPAFTFSINLQHKVSSAATRKVDSMQIDAIMLLFTWNTVFSQIIDFVLLTVKRIYEPKLHFFHSKKYYFAGRGPIIQVIYFQSNLYTNTV